MAWDPNREPNLEGYTVYYTQNTPGPPYNYVGDLPLNDLPDPDNPSTRITDLEKNVNYYFALTAYDTDGNESSFSQELCVRNDGTTYQCATSATVSVGSGGSGGAASCFVQAANGQEWSISLSELSALLSGLLLAVAFLLPILNPKRP